MSESRVGFRFVPTKTELISYFLKAKINDEPLDPSYPISEHDIYSDHPSQIIAATNETHRVNRTEDIYFFTRLKKTTQKGKRVIRVISGHGTWKGQTCKDVYDENKTVVIGSERYLKFEPIIKESANYSTGWKLHEYSLKGNNDIVLCHITRKERRKKNDFRESSDYETGSPIKKTRLNSPDGHEKELA